MLRFCCARPGSLAFRDTGAVQSTETERAMPLKGRRNRCAAGRKRDRRAGLGENRLAGRRVLFGEDSLSFGWFFRVPEKSQPDRRRKKDCFRPRKVELSAPRIRAGPHRVCDDRLDRRKRRTVRRATNVVPVDGFGPCGCVAYPERSRGIPGGIPARNPCSPLVGYGPDCPCGDSSLCGRNGSEAVPAFRAAWNHRSFVSRADCRMRYTKSQTKATNVAG